jgi:predicted amidohydrolase
MRIALAQFIAGPDKEANLGRMLDLTGQAAAAGARLVLFPECSMLHLPPERRPAPLAEPLDGPFVTALAGAARRHGIALVAGVFEPGPDAERAFNTVVALGPAGELLGSYRKSAPSGRLRGSWRPTAGELRPLIASSRTLRPRAGRTEVGRGGGLGRTMSAPPRSKSELLGRRQMRPADRRTISGQSSASKTSAISSE